MQLHVVRLLRLACFVTALLASNGLVDALQQPTTRPTSTPRTATATATITTSTTGTALPQPPTLASHHLTSRRNAIVTATAPAALLAPLMLLPLEAGAESLAAKLSKRDAAALKNSVFNIPPSLQIYPSFMKGSWDISLKFAGYLFPSKTISKDDIVKNVNIPGFQKCSIATITDVGRDKTIFRLTIDKNGLEDRYQTLSTSIDAHLGYKAVENVIYDPTSNPNRIGIEFVKNRTRNAERIELFCNAREAELVKNPIQDNISIFVCSEYVRQVTFSLSQEFGVARQVIGNYAHFWTWKETEDPNVLTGNVLTACYLDPQDALFFQEPSKPVAVYSHQIAAKRVLV